MMERPKAIKTTPGIIIQKLGPRLSSIPLHVSAIGHIGGGKFISIGTGCQIKNHWELP